MGERERELARFPRFTYESLMKGRQVVRTMLDDVSVAPDPGTTARAPYLQDLQVNLIYHHHHHPRTPQKLKKVSGFNDPGREPNLKPHWRTVAGGCGKAPKLGVITWWVREWASCSRSGSSFAPALCVTLGRINPSLGFSFPLCEMALPNWTQRPLSSHSLFI